MGVYKRDSRSDVANFVTRDGDEIMIEIEPLDNDFIPLSNRPLNHLPEVFGPVSAVADAIVSQSRRSHARPDEIAVTFGITVTATGGSVVARAGSDATFTVTLKWHSAPSAKA